MEYLYDHFGVPVPEKREGMLYSSEFRVWHSNYEKDPYRIEWIFFEKESPLHKLIQTIPHVCFLVEDIHKATKGKKLLLKLSYYEGYYMAFIEENGIPIEFLQT